VITCIGNSTGILPPARSVSQRAASAHLAHDGFRHPAAVELMIEMATSGSRGPLTWDESFVAEAVARSLFDL
jgi:hypothetical protein